MNLKTVLRLLGIGLVVLSFCLILQDLAEVGPEALRLGAEPGLLALALAASLGYAALLALPAAAWSCPLGPRDSDACISKTAVLIYARSNILKYLPGNVFQFGGRQVMAHRAGWSHRSTLMATTLEIVALPMAAGCVALVALALSGAPGAGVLAGAQLFTDVTPTAAVLGLTLVGLAVAGTVAAARRLGIAATSLAAMAALEIAFFVANAALIAGLAAAMGTVGPADLPIIAAAYLVSWVAGFVVPGAPGGIGVREAVFVHFTAGVLSAPAALALAILARLVTTLGDLWFALAAMAAKPPGAAARHEG